jgi:hypothetical protein
MNADSTLRVVPAMVAYHTADWIQVAIASYLEHFPADRILVVDNNPRRGEPGWEPDCERERYWLRAHPRVDHVVNTLTPCGSNGERLHGLGIDLAVQWCRDRGADVLLHFEPDCVIEGRRWRENLLRAIESGSSMAGSHQKAYGSIHPTPSAWRIDRVRTTFSGWERAADSRHPRYSELIDLEKLRAEVEPLGLWPWWEQFWDTGEKAWFEAAVQDAATLVDAPDFRHYWNGSGARSLGRGGLLARHPELERWFRAADAQVPPRQVEQCPYWAPTLEEHAGRASCDLLAQWLGRGSPSLYEVPRTACEACSASFPPSAYDWNPVVASLVVRACEHIIERGGTPSCPTRRARELVARAEQDV